MDKNKSCKFTSRSVNKQYRRRESEPWPVKIAETTSTKAVQIYCRDLLGLRSRVDHQAASHGRRRDLFQTRHFAHEQTQLDVQMTNFFGILLDQKKKNLDTISVSLNYTVMKPCDLLSRILA